MVAPTIVSKGRLAVKALRDAEDSAVSGSSDGVDNNSGFYTGNGKDNPESKNGKFNKTKKRIAMLSLIAALMIGGGTFLGTSNSTLLGAFSNITTQVDSQNGSSTRRMPYVVRRAMRQDVSASAQKLRYGKMSKKYTAKLASTGITYSGKGKNTIVTFTKNTIDSDGKAKVVTENYKSDEVIKALDTNNDFYEAFQTARRGRVATFFDNAANVVFQGRLKQFRNVWDNFRRSSDSETNTKNFRETMSSRAVGGDVTANSVYKKAETETDADGKEVIKTDADGNPIIKNDNSDIDIGNSSKTTNIADAKVKAKNMIASVGNKVAGIGNFACAVPRVISMISLMIAAQEIYNSISYFMPMMENVSKTKNGEGDAAAGNEFFNLMSTTATTETTKFGKMQIVEGVNTEGKEETIKQTGSPLQANGMQMLLAGAAIAPATTSLFSLERANRFSWSTTTETEQTCMVGDSTMAVISIGVTIASFGTSKIASEIFGFALSAAIGEAIKLALGFLVPTIAKVFFSNIFDSALGIPAGELFALGAVATLTRLGRNGSGQSLSSKIAAIKYNKVSQAIAAQDAEIDRKNLSPFDMSNKNTFLGSIAYSLLPLTTNSSVTNLSSLISVAGKSLGSILNTSVSADGENTSYMTSFGECPTLEKIGVVGDVYCNPITVTDTSTIDIDPDDRDYLDVILGENDEGGELTCDDDGCVVNKDGDLAKYISFCAGRDSPFGNVDQNILSELQSSSELGSFRGIAGAVPIAGDVLDLIDTAQNAENMPWATGEICGNTEKNKQFWNNKGKYYQRYIEDMRLIDQLGGFEGTQNPVIAFEEEYEAEHPVDDTYIGYLSRISGLLPENVETSLAFMEYYQHLDEYDQSNLIAMTDHPSIIETSETIIAKMETENKNSLKSLPRVIEYISAIVQPKTIYADVRNRNFVAWN